MHRFMALLILMGIGQTISAQYVYTIKADSVKITNSCDTAELILENHTQTVPGFLYNKGRGRTEFRRGVLKLNDSMYVFGADTVHISQFHANNGTSMANGNVVLGNDSGSSAATLASTREIPLNGHNVVFTGNGKLGIGTNNPRDLIELGIPFVYPTDTTTANLRFTYINQPNEYSNVIANRFSGNAPWHYMAFSLTTQGNTITPLMLAGDSKIYSNGHLICSGDVGVNVGGNLPRGPLDVVTTGTGINSTMIVLGNFDRFHYHAIKASFNGAYSWENKIQFYLSPSGDTVSSPTANPLNLLGNGNAIFNGEIGVQQTFPTAYIHVGAGTSAAGTAPVKLTAGTVLSTPEDGAIEYDGTNYYVTQSSTRYTLAKTLTGQLTTNFGVSSINAFSAVPASLSVPGAAVGDVVNVSANTSTVNTASIIITAYVTSANTVTVQAYNASSIAVAIASDTYKVRIIK